MKVIARNIRLRINYFYTDKLIIMYSTKEIQQRDEQFIYLYLSLKTKI